jgi:hypothetical protein
MFNAEILFAKTIKILDTKLLHHKELSGLAYKNDTLYIVANHGKLYTFALKIGKNQITSLVELDSKFLTTKKGKVLKKKKRDAEGLSFFGENLLVSFERKHRVELYSTDGQKIRNITINKLLEDKSSYKSRNRGLEAITYNEKHGVVTLPETPLNNQKKHILYAQERTWNIGIKEKVKAIEFIGEDELLVIVREQSSLTKHKKSLIYYVDLTKDEIQNTELLFKYDGNFEGLTKVKENLFLMVTDSEGGFFQKAQLVLFELVD